MEILLHPLGDEKFLILRPAVVFLGQFDLALAQRLAMSGGGVLLGRRAKGDMAFDHDKRRSVVTLAEVFQRAVEGRLVVGVGDM